MGQTCKRPTSSWAMSSGLSPPSRSKRKLTADMDAQKEEANQAFSSLLETELFGMPTPLRNHSRAQSASSHCTSTRPCPQHTITITTSNSQHHANQRQSAYGTSSPASSSHLRRPRSGPATAVSAAGAVAERTGHSGVDHAGAATYAGAAASLPSESDQSDDVLPGATAPHPHRPALPAVQIAPRPAFPSRAATRDAPHSQLFDTHRAAADTPLTALRHSFYAIAHPPTRATDLGPSTITSDIHTLSGPGKAEHSLDASNTISSMLARGTIQVADATSTNKENQTAEEAYGAEAGTDADEGALMADIRARGSSRSSRMIGPNRSFRH
ncbi:hypothetical protein V8E36_002282 [Tilletia maclaganii]